MRDKDVILNVAAKAVIINSEGKVLILRESAKHDTNTRTGRYQLPGGRIDAGEALLDGLKREVMEETGLSIRVGRALTAGEWRPIIKGVPHQIIGMFFMCTTGSEKVRLSEEHNHALWIDPATYKQYDVISPDWEAIETFVRSADS